MFPCSGTVVPCIGSHKSAGLLVLCIVMDQMVGDRRSPGATVLGSEFVYLLRQSSLPGPPRSPAYRDVFWTVYEMAGPARSDGCGVAASFLTRCRGSRNLRPRRCGDFGLVSRHEPAEHRFPIIPLLLTLGRRASHAGERLRNQRLSRAGKRLRDQRLSHHQSSPVGFDVACSETPGGFTPATFLINSNAHFIVYPFAHLLVDRSELHLNANHEGRFRACLEDRPLGNGSVSRGLAQ